MNDFTKDELNIIAAHVWKSDYRGHHKGLEDLYHKIVSIIDNHEKQSCANCALIREGELLDKFWDKGHWSQGGAFCGEWV